MTGSILTRSSGCFAGLFNLCLCGLLFFFDGLNVQGIAGETLDKVARLLAKLGDATGPHCAGSVQNTRCVSASGQLA